VTRRPRLTLATSSSSIKSPPRGFAEQAEPDGEQPPPIRRTAPAEDMAAGRGLAVSGRSGSWSPAAVTTTVILFGLAVASIVLLKRRLF
jgi:hypothetical protein